MTDYGDIFIEYPSREMKTKKLSAVSQRDVDEVGEFVKSLLPKG